MDKADNSFQNFLERLRKNYRVSVIDETSLKERNSFQISGLKMLIISLLIFCGVFLLSMLFFSIPPIKKLFIGSGNVENSSAFIKLNKQVLSLEESLEKQQTYTEGLKRMLNGDSETIQNSNPEFIKIEKVEQSETVDADVAPNQKNATSRVMHLISPIKGQISAGFDRSIGHFGVDIIAPKNSPIVSVGDGVVVSADWTIKTGNTINVQHEDNIISVYKHNSVLLKDIGDVVKSGEAIAIIGNSGEQTSGPHLHFELWLDGNALDPVQFIPF